MSTDNFRQSLEIINLKSTISVSDVSCANKRKKMSLIYLEGEIHFAKLVNNFFYFRLAHLNLEIVFPVHDRKNNLRSSAHVNLLITDKQCMHREFIPARQLRCLDLHGTFNFKGISSNQW